MKNYFALIITILLSIAATAQTERDLKEFVGTWKYENPDSCEVFIIKLKTIVHDIYETKYVYGNYSYSKNNVTIEDNLHQFDTLSDLALFPIILRPWYPYSSTKQTLRFSDRTYGYNSCLDTSFVELIDEKKETKLKWFMEIGGTYVYEHDEEMPPNHFSVPSNVIFTKVE